MKRKAYDGFIIDILSGELYFCPCIDRVGYCSNSDGNRCNRY